MRDPIFRPWWQKLGALLPTEVRERVYEPACYDHLRHVLETNQTSGIGAYPVGAFVLAAGRNLPRIWTDGKHLSGIGRAALIGGGASFTAWMLTVIRYTSDY